jgi:hypothetical protein
MRIHKLSGTYQLDDFRFITKTMASKLSLKRGLYGGRVPMRKINDSIMDGKVTAYDLQRWYPHAVRILRTSSFTNK